MSLLEIVIACAIMASTSIIFFKYMANTKRIEQGSAYTYTAMNLARDIIEWGAASSFAHWNEINYYSSNNTYYNTWSWSGGTVATTQFSYIWSLRLVPPAAPYSVKVNYKNYPSIDGAYRQDVRMEWRDTENGPPRKLELSAISLSHVNDQLHLKVASFKWEKERP